MHFDRLETALRFLDTRVDKEKLVFLHAGHFYPEPLVIDSAVQIVGAGMSEIVFDISKITPKLLSRDRKYKSASHSECFIDRFLLIVILRADSGSSWVL